MDTDSVKIDILDENKSVYDEKESTTVESTVKQRVGYKTDTFRKEYRQPDLEPLTFREKCKEYLKKFSTPPRHKKEKLAKILPILKIYKKYQIKTDLPSDAISGFTVGIMQLPQGMAYAMLADLPPVVGLYMSFFPVLIYFLLGTSRQISMGTVAVVSLMIGSIVSKVALPTSSLISTTTSSVNVSTTTSDSGTNFTNYNDTTTKVPIVSSSALSDLDLQKIALASTMCLMVGIIQVLFGVFRLGFVTTYMSDPLVSGFTTGAAVHVFTSQVKYIFGLDIPRYPNLLQIVYTYKAIILNLPKTNLPTLLASAICIVILYLVKVQINYRFKHKMKIPIPIELFVVIVATVLSHFLKFKKTYGIKVVGTIPAGLPPFSAPSLSDSSQYFSDAVIIAIVAFAQSVSLAALMAKKHKYIIDASQEFIAYGFGNIFGSFFSCYPFAASVSRSSVQDSAGGKSQIASLFSATLVLIVILVIGPLFESLPNCVLASIIVVALRTMFYQILELKELWKISVYDFFIWIITFCAVVILYVDLGLWIGLIFSFLTVVVRTQFTKLVTIQKISGLDTFADKKKYKQTEGSPGILALRINSPIYFANADIFVKKVYKLSKMKPERARRRIKRLGSIQEFRRQSIISNKPNLDPRGSNPNPLESVTSMESFGVTTTGHIPMSIPDVETETYLHHIIIDCSSVCFIDTVGGKVMKQMVDQYKTIGIKVFLASVKDEVWEVLHTTGFLELYKDNIYFSVSDAVVAAIEDPDEFADSESITHM